MRHPDGANDSETVAATRTLFTTQPFSKLLTSEAISVAGNSNGQVFEEDANGHRSPFAGDMKIVFQRVVDLLQQIVPMNPSGIGQLDAAVEGQEFCLTLTGPPTTVGWNWVIARRKDINEIAVLPIAFRLDLKEDEDAFRLPSNASRSAEPNVEGTFRRGYHQGVAAVADALRAGNLTVKDIDAWVQTKGMQWRSETLTRMIPPPRIGD